MEVPPLHPVAVPLLLNALGIVTLWKLFLSHLHLPLKN
jgi:hypothetical protein